MFFLFLQNPKNNTARIEIPTIKHLEKILLKGILCSRRTEHMQWAHCQTESDLAVLAQWSGHLAIGSNATSSDCS